MDQELNIICKIDDVTLSGYAQGYIIINKDKQESMEKSIQLLRQLKGQDVKITVTPYQRVSR